LVLTLPPSELVQFTQRDAGLNHSDVVAFVDAHHLTHLVKGDNETTVDRERTTRKSRARTARSNGHLVASGPTNQLGDLLRAARAGHGEGFSVTGVQRLIV
jgi:hypothetical protein